MLDPYNGDILGVVGCIGQKRGNLIQNYATQTKRPPGSAIKPLSVYAPLIDNGAINWATVVEDSPTCKMNGRDWPQNANRKYSGNINICDAIANSTNTVAVKMLDALGEDRSYDFLLRHLKIKNLQTADKCSTSLALGQLVKGITLRELVGGYTIFAQGVMSEPRSYYKVLDRDGKILFDKRNNQEHV